MATAIRSGAIVHSIGRRDANLEPALLAQEGLGTVQLEGSVAWSAAIPETLHKHELQPSPDD